MKPGVFLDRDGVLIEDVPYLTDPAQVRLREGAAEALSRLREAGFALVVVTNQSAIGRGMLSSQRLEEIHRRLTELLEREGAWLDAIYHCPEPPRSDDRSVIEHHDRKPGPGMLLRAARELDIDLRRSWMVGDMLSDALAGRNAGVARVALMVNPAREQPEEAHRAADCVVESLSALADLVIQSHDAGSGARR